MRVIWVPEGKVGIVHNMSEKNLWFKHKIILKDGLQNLQNI